VKEEAEETLDYQELKYPLRITRKKEVIPQEPTTAGHAVPTAIPPAAEPGETAATAVRAEQAPDIRSR
jgi:hypothetical protein